MRTHWILQKPFERTSNRTTLRLPHLLFISFKIRTSSTRNCCIATADIDSNLSVPSAKDIGATNRARSSPQSPKTAAEACSSTCDASSCRVKGRPARTDGRIFFMEWNGIALQNPLVCIYPILLVSHTAFCK